MSWEIEFFEDDAGRQPARMFLLDLDAPQRMAMIAAIECFLEPRGLDVCATEYGRQLGDGLFEFRLRHDEPTIRRKAGLPSVGDGGSTDVLLRLFCHAYGQKVILLLGGYDKGKDPSSRRQSREIETARRNLRSFRLRQQRRSAGEKRRGKG
jgi:hypothetical protein